MNDQEEQILTIDEAMAMDDAELDATIARLQSGKEALLAKMQTRDEVKKKLGRPPSKKTQPPNSNVAAATAADLLNTAAATTAPSNSATTEAVTVATSSSSSNTIPHTTAPTKVPPKRQKEKPPTVAELHLLVRSLQSQLTASELRIEALERALKSAPAPTPRQQLQVVNLAARDSAERERRTANVIVRGLHPVTNTDDTVKTFLQSACKESAPPVKTVRRLRTKASATTDTPRTEQLACPILVTFEETSQRDHVLRSAPRRNAKDHCGAFAHEDRTPAQQQQFLDCLREATKRNSVLARHSLLRQPYLWVIRGDRVRCTDAKASSLAKKSVYVTDFDVYAAINSAKLTAPNYINNPGENG
jgi:hypothetical protein